VSRHLRHRVRLRHDDVDAINFFSSTSPTRVAKSVARAANASTIDANADPNDLGDATADDVILAAVPDATRVYGRTRR
jgi:hypothetical protein